MVRDLGRQPEDFRFEFLQVVMYDSSPKARHSYVSWWAVSGC